MAICSILNDLSACSDKPTHMSLRRLKGRHGTAGTPAREDYSSVSRIRDHFLNMHDSCQNTCAWPHAHPSDEPLIQRFLTLQIPRPVLERALPRRDSHGSSRSCPVARQRYITYCLGAVDGSASKRSPCLHLSVRRTVPVSDC